MKPNTSSLQKNRNQSQASSKLNASLSHISNTKSPKSNQSFYQQVLINKKLKYSHYQNQNTPDKENKKQIPKFLDPKKSLHNGNRNLTPKRTYSSEKIKMQALINEQKLEKTSISQCNQYEIIPTNLLHVYQNSQINNFCTHPNTSYKKGSKQLQDLSFSRNSVNNYYTNISTSELNDVRINLLQDVTNINMGIVETKGSLNSSLYQSKCIEEQNNCHQKETNPLNMYSSSGSTNGLSLHLAEETQLNNLSSITNQIASRNNSNLQQKAFHQTTPIHHKHNEYLSINNKPRHINNNQEKSDQKFNQTLAERYFKKTFQTKRTSLNLDNIMGNENRIKKNNERVKQSLGNIRLENHKKGKDYELEPSLYDPSEEYINKSILTKQNGTNEKSTKRQNSDNSWQKFNFEESDVQKSSKLQTKFSFNDYTEGDDYEHERIILNENEIKFKNYMKSLEKNNNISSEILATMRMGDTIKKIEIEDLSLSTEKSGRSLSIQNSQNSNYQTSHLSVSEMATMREDMLEKDFEDMILKLKYNIQKLLIKTELNQKEIMQLQEIQEKEKKLLGNYQQTHNVLLAEVCSVKLFF